MGSSTKQLLVLNSCRAPAPLCPGMPSIREDWDAQIEVTPTLTNLQHSPRLMMTTRTANTATKSKATVRIKGSRLSDLYKKAKISTTEYKKSNSKPDQRLTLVSSQSFPHFQLFNSADPYSLFFHPQMVLPDQLFSNRDASFPTHTPLSTTARKKLELARGRREKI